MFKKLLISVTFLIVTSSNTAFSSGTNDQCNQAVRNFQLDMSFASTVGLVAGASGATGGTAAVVALGSGALSFIVRKVTGTYNLNKNRQEYQNLLEIYSAAESLSQENNFSTPCTNNKFQDFYSGLSEYVTLKAIEDLQREYAEASKIDFVKHSRELARLRDQAVINGQIGPAVNAEYRRGQLAGFYVDRKEVVTASLDNMSRPELEAKLKEIRDHNIVNGEFEEIEDKSS